MCTIVRCPNDSADLSAFGVIDAEIAEKGHLWTETNSHSSAKSRWTLTKSYEYRFDQVFWLWRMSNNVPLCCGGKATISIEPFFNRDKPASGQLRSSNPDLTIPKPIKFLLHNKDQPDFFHGFEQVTGIAWAGGDAWSD